MARRTCENYDVSLHRKCSPRKQNIFSQIDLNKKTPNHQENTAKIYIPNLRCFQFIKHVYMNQLDKLEIANNHLICVHHRVPEIFSIVLNFLAIKFHILNPSKKFCLIIFLKLKCKLSTSKLHYSLVVT